MFADGSESAPALEHGEHDRHRRQPVERHVGRRRRLRQPRHVADIGVRGRRGGGRRQRRPLLVAHASGQSSRELERRAHRLLRLQPLAPRRPRPPPALVGILFHLVLRGNSSRKLLLTRTLFMCFTVNMSFSSEIEIENALAISFTLFHLDGFYKMSL